MTEIQTDALIIEQVRAGDREAFRLLVERYSGLVYHIAYQMCFNQDRATEVVQEVFYRAYKSIAQYKADWSFKTWLRRITVNYLLDEHKKKKLEYVSMTTEENDVLEFADTTYDPSRNHLEQEREALLAKAVAELPEKECMAINLRHFQELNYDEIAEIMELPLGTVMTHIHRGRKRLAQRLAQYKNDLLSDHSSLEQLR